MIIRDILTRESIEPFDFFNDGKDTLAWLSMLRTPEAIVVHDRLREAYDKFIAEWRGYTAFETGDKQ